MKLWHWVALFIIISGFIFLSIGSALNESLTFDEIVHLQEGRNHWINHTFAVDPFNPPLVRELVTIPVILGADRLLAGDRTADHYLPGRMVSVVFGVVLLILVFVTAKKYSGPSAAIFSTLFLAVQPTLLAYDHYLGLDMGTALFVFVAYLALVRFVFSDNLLNLVYFGVAAGAAAASRVNTLLFIFLTIPAVSFFRYRKKTPGKFWQFRYRWILAGIIAAFTIWAAYFFRFGVIIAARDDSNRISTKLLAEARKDNRRLLENLIILAEYRKIPLGDYLAVIKNNIIRNGQATTFFFLGKNYPANRWYFLPANIFLKTPLPFWLLLFLAIRNLYRGKGQRKQFFIFAVPAAVILGVMCLSSATAWVRYALPVIPFLAIIAGNGVSKVKDAGGKLIILLLCFWSLAEVFSAYPHFITYANQLAGPGNTLYLSFNDSNLDWGQSLPDLARYLDRVNPKVVSFSYFGRDNGDDYGLVSNFPYGSHRFGDICRFHEIVRPNGSDKRVVAISVTNWYNCKFKETGEFSRNKIKDIVARSILIFGN